KVMEAEQTKTRSELVHKETAAKYNAAMGRMKQLEKKLKRAINKSKYVLHLEMSLVVQSVNSAMCKYSSAICKPSIKRLNIFAITMLVAASLLALSCPSGACEPWAAGERGRITNLNILLNIAVASEVFEDDNGSSFISEEDSETQSVSSFSSGPTSPCEVLTQFPPATRPGSLDLPSPVSLSEFGMVFPVLGPRSECRDRAEGAENKTSDRVNKNRSSTRSSSTEGLALDNRMKQLSLQCMKIKEGICAGRKAAQIG
ncbi:3BP5 protein, partial [Neodrepanis coruscans]|nr:3BP5 protein [Neodrepanis coruscans]